jgi:hypothetical protein
MVTPSALTVYKIAKCHAHNLRHVLLQVVPGAVILPAPQARLHAAACRRDRVVPLSVESKDSTSVAKTHAAPGRSELAGGGGLTVVAPVPLVVVVAELPVLKKPATSNEIRAGYDQC